MDNNEEKKIEKIVNLVVFPYRCEEDGGEEVEEAHWPTILLRQDFDAIISNESYKKHIQDLLLGDRFYCVNTSLIINEDVYDKMPADTRNELFKKSELILVGAKDEERGDDFTVCWNIEDAIATAHCENIFIWGSTDLCRSALEEERASNMVAIYNDINSTCNLKSMPVPFRIPKKIASGPVMSLVEGYCLGGTKKVGLSIEHGYNVIDSQYTLLVKDILLRGVWKNTRSGRVKSLFGKTFRIDISRGFPVLTTKKMFMKGVIHELLWFIKGDTNIKYLVDNGVHIWDDDAYRYYLSIIDLHNENIKEEPQKDWFTRGAYEKVSKEEFMEGVKEGRSMNVVFDKTAYFMSYQPNVFEKAYTFGDLGPVYGHQWTKWVDHMSGNVKDKKGQLETVIDMLKNNPDDRRMIISAWNVGEMSRMALPPCHYACQFYSREMDEGERIDAYIERHPECRDKTTKEVISEMAYENFPTRTLSCLWNQRSVDVGLGLPFNIMSYALFTYMIAQCVNMLPEELIFMGGDCHIYEDHIEKMQEQAGRPVNRYSSPTLSLNPKVNKIEDFTYEDIKVEGYHSYPAVKMPLSVGLNTNNQSSNK